MKPKSLPAIAWIAIGFAACLLTSLVAANHFQLPPFAFMSAAWWWLDLAGLAVTTGVWLYRAAKYSSAPLLA